METLAKLDPYAIQEIQFFVQKKPKYTTLKSILVSLVILTLTVILNINVIKHLQIDISELPVVSSERIMSLQPLTSNYICIIAKTTATTLPATTMFMYDRKTDTPVKELPSTDKFNENQDILRVANGRKFVCHDVEGAYLSVDYYLRMIVPAVGADFEIMYKTYSALELMGMDKSNYYHYSKSTSVTFGSFSFTHKKIRAIYYDSLLINYEPEQILGLSPTMFEYFWSSSLGYSYVQLQSQQLKPYDTMQEYVITRHNIGQILGKILSWFSIFVMIVAFGITPILDYNYKVELSQKLYDNQKLNRINISLLSYLKYLISHFKKNLFDEQILPSAFDQLQRDIDLLNLIKKQAMMKKLIKENESLNMQINESQNTLIEDTPDNVEQLFIRRQLSLDQSSFNEISNAKLLAKQLEQEGNLLGDQTESPLLTDVDQKSKDNGIVSLVKCFDIGEVSISLISNKGEGYKTSWNTIITVLFLCALLWFLIFAGLFQMDPNYTISSVLVRNDETQIPKITINPLDIILRANRTVTSPYRLGAFILNHNDQVIQTLTLLNLTNCDAAVNNLNQTVGSGWLCLDKPITLWNDGKQNKAKLGLKLVYTGFGFTVTNIEARFYHHSIVDNELKKSSTYIKRLFSSSSTYAIDSQLIVKQSDQEEEDYWTCNQGIVYSEAVFKGITIELKPQFLVLDKQTPTIWDVIDTTWGITVLAFSVFLSKITRYLNVRERQKIIQNQQNQNRNDIVSIISTQYKLIYQVFYNQLKQVKYFYKTRFSDLQFKER